MITWEQLPVGEKNALSRWINIDREFVNEFEKGLQAKGLIRIVRIDHHRHQNMLTDLGKRVLAQAASGQPTTITAEKLVENLAEWATLKDVWKINLLWKDDHIDGIGKVGERYVIQYGGIVNDPDYVTGDTLIQIEWLPQATTGQPEAEGEDEWGGLVNGRY